MATLHIIGVGGTGAKLINACVHLAGAGAFSILDANNNQLVNNIRIVEIDADPSNGSCAATGKDTDAYNKFYNAVVHGNNNHLGLVNIERLPDINLCKDRKDSIKKTFSFADFIPDANATGTERLSNILYTPEEIEMVFDEGFYGRPSVGTLIVKDVLTNDPNWIAFKKGNAGGNRGLLANGSIVVVMGSIFGGTGSSAIPVLLDELNAIKNGDGVVPGLNPELKYAVLMLTPYFNTAGQAANAPDARTFSPKAQAALHYYYDQYFSNAKQNPDAVYIIGEPTENFSVEKKAAGGSNQTNKPHVLEVFAASALIDFARDPSSGNNNSLVRTAEREKVNLRLKDKRTSAFGNTWKMVTEIHPEIPDSLQRFMKICIFYNKILYRELNKNRSMGTWLKKFKNLLKDDSGKLIEDDTGPVYESIHNYTTRFVNWFFALHKMIDQETRSVDWEDNWKPDARVQLFFTGEGDKVATKKLFTGEISGIDIENFENLVFGNEGDSSEDLYIKLCSCQKPEQGEGFVSLFGTLRALITKAPGSGDKDPKVKWPDYFPTKANTGASHITRTNNKRLWAKSQINVLEDVAEGLSMGAGTNNFGPSDVQIPSPWSIFIMQELALTNPAFANLFDGAYEQWAAFIALVALRKFCAWENQGLMLRRLDTAGTEFTMRVVGTLTPKNHIFVQDSSWSDHYALLLDLGSRQETLGLLAYNTLICPAYTISEAVWVRLYEIAPGMVNYNPNGEVKYSFKQPARYFSDEPSARRGLCEFVELLRVRLSNNTFTNLNTMNPNFIALLQNLLQKLAGDLGNAQPSAKVYIETDAPVASVHDIFTKLVPITNPWEIFIAHEWALTDPAFKNLNPNAFNEWAGLIALLGLRKLCYLEEAGLALIEVRPVDNVIVPPPESHVFQNPHWQNHTEIVLKTANNTSEVLGFLAANTFVCPAKISDAAWASLRVLMPGLVDRNKNEFRDPSAYFNDTKQNTDAAAKYGLKEFVGELLDVLNNESANNNQPIIGILQAQLGTFSSSLGNPAANVGVELPQNRDVSSVAEVFNKLIPTPSKWNDVFLDTLTLIDKKDKVGKVFQNELFHSPKSTPQILDCEIIWPLRDSILDELSAEDISKGLSLSVDRDKIRIELKFNMKGVTHLVWKEYSKAPNNIPEKGTWYTRRRIELPMWAVWPYAELFDEPAPKGQNKWHIYKYFLYEWEINETFKIEPYFGTANSGSFRGAMDKIGHLSDNRHAAYYGEYGGLPRVLKLSLRTQNVEQAAGLVFLAKPHRIEQLNVTWKIGVDFGTTSTSAFYHDGRLDHTGKPELDFVRVLSDYKWNYQGNNMVWEPSNELDNRRAILCNSGDEAGGLSNFEHFFIDEKCFDQSGYLTAWEELGKNSGRVFWQNKNTFSLDKFDNNDRRHKKVKTNLKWQGETELSELYLKQLLIQFIFQAAQQDKVKQIEWFFSYPTAFDYNARDWFKDIITGLVGQNGSLSSNKTGVLSKFTSDDAHFVPESIAAARYFIQTKANAGLYLCVDIGGGTSDISIWYQDKGIRNYVFQSSVRFASGEMFVHPLHVLLSDQNVLNTVITQNNQDPIHFLNYFWGDEHKAGQKHSLSMNDAQLSAVLSEYADAVRRRLRNAGNLNNMFGFNTYVLIAYSGLCYYLAHIIAALFDPKNSKIPDEFKRVNQIIFGLSGRGAKLTNWIDSNHVHEEMGKLISDLVGGKKRNADFKINVAFNGENAKTETAQGLLCNVNMTENIPPDSLFMGIDTTFKSTIDMGSEKRGTNDFVSRLDDFVKNKKDWKAEFDEKIKSIADFVDFYDRIADRIDDVNPIEGKAHQGWFSQNKVDLKQKIENAFGNEERFEAPFIIAFKEFLSEYGEAVLGITR